MPGVQCMYRTSGERMIDRTLPALADVGTKLGWS